MNEHRRLILIWLICAAAACLAAAYYFFDPAEAAWMPRCLWKATTGTDCPGCGSQRMAHALLHGDFGGAWRANAFGVCLLPAAAFLLWIETRRERHPRLYARIHSPWAIRLLAVAVAAWWVVRNL